MCIFCKIVNGELPANLVKENDDFMETTRARNSSSRPSYSEARRPKTNCNDCRSCAKCKEYYRVLERHAIDINDSAFMQQNAVKNSRHTKYTPGISSQDTPADFWECSFIDSQERRREALQMLNENNADDVAEMEAEELAASTAPVQEELMEEIDDALAAPVNHLTMDGLEEVHTQI